MAYQVIRKVKGHYYLYVQESYREGQRVRTRSRYLGRLDKRTGEITEQDRQPESVLNCRVKLDKYKISVASLEEAYAAFTNTLEKIGINTEHMPEINIKHGKEPSFKQRGNSFIVYLPRNQTGNRSKFQQAYRKALAKAGLILLADQKPETFSDLKYQFDASYRSTQNLLNTYILNTNDYSRQIKAITLKWFGVFRPTYKNPLKAESLGLTALKREGWQDEYADLMAGIIQKGYEDFYQFWKAEEIKARNAEKKAVAEYLNHKKKHQYFIKNWWLE